MTIQSFCLSFTCQCDKPAEKSVRWTLTKFCPWRKYFNQSLPIFLLFTILLKVFYKIPILKNFAQFTGKPLCGSLFFFFFAGLRPTTSLKRESDTGVFLRISEIFKKRFFMEHLRWLLSFTGHSLFVNHQNDDKKWNVGCADYFIIFLNF